jgi:hypothetical protein
VERQLRPHELAESSSVVTVFSCSHDAAIARPSSPIASIDAATSASSASSQSPPPEMT